ncbi:MAG: hypothetical protein IK080_01185 [Clostridia bacterium]|nr:hypothetical protein [Clostridia bacterium]
MRYYKKSVIGFRDESDEEIGGVLSTAPVTVQEKEPFCCIAKIRFKEANIALDYYNDAFYLEPGDKVFVTGKYYGKLGFVERVTTHFRIDKTKYKKVIAKPDLRITGSFQRVNDKMISFDTNFDADRFGAIMIPPRDPDDDPEEILCGEGWRVELDCFEDSESVDPEKLHRGLDLCRQGNVLYLSLQQGRGAAYIRGSRVYKAEFDFDGETVSNLFCSCPFNDDCLCKHETAVLITLRMLLDQPELEDRTDFVAFDTDFFWNYVSCESKAVALQ